MKFLLVLAALAASVAALPAPAQAAQFPPGTVHSTRIGIPKPGQALPAHEQAKRAGLDHAHIASGDCAVKGVSCKEEAIQHNEAKNLFLKTGN